MTKLKPGQLDERGRLFLGWRTRCGTGGLRGFAYELLPAPSLLRCGHCRIFRVYRKESATRRALRELVADVESAIGKNLTGLQLEALPRARKVLEET